LKGVERIADILVNPENDARTFRVLSRQSQTAASAILPVEPPLSVFGWSCLTLLAVFTIQQLVHYGISLQLDATALTAERRSLIAFCSAIILGAATGIVILMARPGRSKGSGLPELFTLTVQPTMLLFWLLMAVICNLAIEWLGQQLGRPNTSLMQSIAPGVTSSLWETLLISLAVLISAPLFEELLFRGYMFYHLSHTSPGVAGAILLPNLMWSLSHFAQYDALGLLMIFVAGLVFSWARWKTDSLITPVIMHMGFNATTLALQFC
jgi:hypothetical protein